MHRFNVAVNRGNAAYMTDTMARLIGRLFVKCSSIIVFLFNILDKPMTHILGKSKHHLHFSSDVRDVI